MPVKTKAIIDSATEKGDAKTAEEITETVGNDTNESRPTGDRADSLDIPTDAAETDQDSEDGAPAEAKRRINWSRVLVFGMLPAVVLLLAIAAAFLKWQDGSMRASEIARIESVQTAKDTTVALLSYQPDTVEQELGAARKWMTGDFKDEYTQLVQEVVIPGAQQQRISTTASVPAAASVSATPNHAVVLLFVNQTTIVGTSAPSDLQSSVRVTMDKINDRWLISEFDPV